MSTTPGEKLPKDKKPYSRDVGPRYAFQSGKSTIHGMTLYEVQTQEAQSFGFYSGTGQGGTGSGPGEGRAVLDTPGMSYEVLGAGLKAKGTSNENFNPAKYILCKRGDILLEAKDGDIILKGKNVRIFAEGGGDDGDFTVKANKVASIKGMDVRVQAEKLSLSASNTLNAVSKGFLEIQGGFVNVANAGDLDLTSLGQLIKGLSISSKLS
jgi:hypothetical protein